MLVAAKARECRRTPMLIAVMVYALKYPDIDD